jgi:serine/threonine-protein kinase
MQGGDKGPASSRRQWADTLASGARPGDILAGKYRIDRVLGTGGVGVVVAATHLSLDERVAIKFLLPAAAKDHDAVVRFDREARAAVKIKSEHVARVTDVGKLDSGAPYMVMEYLEGRDLARLIEGGGPLPIDTATEYVLQACEALADAHALGIVHRDIKPSNLFLTWGTDGAPRVKVLDFGISKIMPRTGSVPDPAMTRTRAVMGSPLYMSPEQMESSRDVDERTDIWGIGVILYELLAGVPAFNGPTMAQVCTRILHGAPTPLRDIRSEIPSELEAAILRCLAKAAAMRFADVGELALALLPFAPRRAHASVKRVIAVIESSGVARKALEMPPPPESAPILGRPMGVLPLTQGAWGPVQTNPPIPGVGSRLPLLAASAGLVLIAGIAAGFYVASGRGSAASSIAPAPSVSVTAAPADTSATPPADVTSAEPSTSSAPIGDAAVASATAKPIPRPPTRGARVPSPRDRQPAATSAPTTAPKIDPGVLDER